uniref:Cadherin-1 n=2 Tax=Neolamprologus brichardi TaxID=32507 RepID=A0A3Q4I2T8_NEOBR
MGTALFAVFGALIVVFQVSALERANRPTCVPGFESELLVFRVSREHLRPGMRLGKVGFTDCTERTVFLFSTDDSRFTVKADGTLTVKREVVLHKGHRNFFIHSWDSQGNKITVPVSVVHPEHHHRHHRGKHHHGNATDPQVPVLQFPKSGGGLRRRKRDWVIPPLNVPENQRGKYPLKVAQVSIKVTGTGLDREKYPEYTLTVQAADMGGEGLTGQTKVILTVTDSNDNAPVFTQSSYTATVDENKKDVEVVRMIVTDEDEPQTPAWNAKFKIVSGDPDGLFTVKTGTNKQEGILSTAKELDFERASKHTLLISVENEIPFAPGVSVVTSTATVVVNVKDVNEAPIFDPKEKLVVKPENLAVDEVVVQYTASDPDTARKQKVAYKMIDDPAGWLTVDKDTGLIKVGRLMDREAIFVTNNRYTATIGAYDNDAVPATGTGTLIIQLEDVNDNAPVVELRNIKVCNKEPAPQLLSVTDKDGPEFGPPYSVSLQGMSKTNWTARMNDTRTGIILNLATELPSGEYSVILRVADKHGLGQDNIITAKVCDCRGTDLTACSGPGRYGAAASNLPLILGILGAILLLALLLLVLLFTKQRKREKKEPLLLDDGVRDNVYYYDEEGGGEDDQDYDLSVLHRGLDNRPDVLRNEVMPNFMPAPQYRPRPANPEEIGNFIEDNLKAADNDPTAPPYDSLLVFDYEGGGSDAGSLSSLNSSGSGDQNYDCLNEWGPRFKKLADMYGGGDDDDML